MSQFIETLKQVVALCLELSGLLLLDLVLSRHIRECGGVRGQNLLKQTVEGLLILLLYRELGVFLNNLEKRG